MSEISFSRLRGINRWLTRKFRRFLAIRPDPCHGPMDPWTNLQLKFVLFPSLYFFGFIFRKMDTNARVPGLPIRDCARGCNNRDPTWPKLSAIDVTSKTFFERVYLVLGWQKFVPWVTCPYAPTTPTITLQLFLDLFAIFSPNCTYIFFSTIHQEIWPSPGTLPAPSILCHDDHWYTHGHAFSTYQCVPASALGSSANRGEEGTGTPD